MVMTQQYLAGELSVILGEVQAAATIDACARQARDLLSGDVVGGHGGPCLRR